MPILPILPIEEMVRGLTANSARTIRAAFRRSNGVTATLRASKPFRKIDPTGPRAEFEASANYVWRMLCFDFVASRPHNCFPCTADFDIYAVLKARGDCDGVHKATRDMTIKLDQQIRIAESVMPVTAQRGIMSWRGLV